MPRLNGSGTVGTSLRPGLRGNFLAQYIRNPIRFCFLSGVLDARCWELGLIWPLRAR